MTIKNVLKDGTIVDDMSTVTVPKEIAYRIFRIAEKQKEEAMKNERMEKKND